jgi:hypothetical protein
MTYRDLWMWYIAYGEAAGGTWDHEKMEWQDQTTT